MIKKCPSLMFLKVLSGRGESTLARALELQAQNFFTASQRGCRNYKKVQFIQLKGLKVVIEPQRTAPSARKGADSEVSE